MKFTRKSVLLSLFILLQIVFLKFIKLHPALVEKYYATLLFPFISNSLRFLFGWISVSLGDLLYLILILIIIRHILKLVKAQNFKKLFFHITSIFAALSFLFHFIWGLNYYRLPLANKLFNASQKKVDSTNLYAFTKNLIKQTNAIKLISTKDTSFQKNSFYHFNELQTIAVESYHSISKKHSFLAYKNKSIKYSLFSIPLTYMGFSGYINPFTLEAQINFLHTQVNKPTTILHEMAHQIGFAAENEANFIACITALNSNDLYFKYAGSFMALKHCLYDVYKIDKNKYSEFYKLIDKNVITDFDTLKAFNKRYENPFEPIFKSIYSLFLKANSQQHGIQSYSYMVSLLLEYEKQNNNLLLLL